MAIILIRSYRKENIIHEVAYTMPYYQLGAKETNIGAFNLETDFPFIPWKAPISKSI